MRSGMEMLFLYTQREGEKAMAAPCHGVSGKLTVRHGKARKLLSILPDAARDMEEVPGCPYYLAGTRDEEADTKRKRECTDEPRIFGSFVKPDEGSVVAACADRSHAKAPKDRFIEAHAIAFSIKYNPSMMPAHPIDAAMRLL